MARLKIRFMHVDQMHWEAMSAYGNAHVKTPNLDRLAADVMALAKGNLVPDRNLLELASRQVLDKVCIDHPMGRLCI